MERHFEFWPKRMPRSLALPGTSILYNLEVSMTHYPEKTAIVYYGTEISYRRLGDEAENTLYEHPAPSRRPALSASRTSVEAR